MNATLPWSVALRIAWREMRAARARFLFVVLAVAIGTGALTGVRGFAGSFRRMLLREARTLMAADLSARIFALPTAEQEAVLRGLELRGVRRTWITETVTMASSGAAPNPVLVALKAVDPGVYPFYGEVRLQPPRPLGAALGPDSAVVSDDLLVRLSVRPGDMLRIGGCEFRIAGLLVSEPDRMTGTLNVGPRVMLSRAGLDRTGLIGIGSRASERYLFRLPPGGVPGVGQVRPILKQAFPEASIADYRETHPIITRGLNRATTYLGLIGLIALAIGAMGVASAMRGHLQQKLDSIAILKCIGARSGQVIRIYVSETLLLGLAGGTLGALFGIGVAAAFPGMIARYFAIDVARSWDPWPAVQGIGIACLITLLFTLPPLYSIRDIKPAQVFRRDVEGAPGLGHSRAGRPSAPQVRLLLLRLAILLGTAAIAATLTEGSPRVALRTGLYFAFALAAGLGLLALAARLFLRFVRGFLASAGARLPGAVRHGLANLYRPGNQARPAVIALGVGVMFTLMVFLIQDALVRQIRGSTPPNMPNVFLLDIPGPQRQAVGGLIAGQAGVKASPDIAFAVAARITAVDGVAIGSTGLGGHHFAHTRSVTEMAGRPPDTEILEGAWWDPAASEPQVCLNEESAAALRVHPGSTLDWTIWGRALRTRVACVQRTESVRMAARFEFIFSPGHLAGFPAVWYGSARVRPADVPALQRAVYERFPTVTVVNVADVMQIVEQVVERIALVIRFLSAFTILAGAVMVASSVAGTRFRRIREVVILKTLGATRRRIAWIFSVEFLAMGLVAGVVGALLASAFSALLLKQLLEIDFRPGIGVNAVAVLAAAAVSTAAGWLASFRILGRKPLEILREE
jgi:putative ABC transport system permease protein